MPGESRALHTNILAPDGHLAYQLSHGTYPVIVAETIRYLLND